MQRPSKGRIVIVGIDPAKNNGDDTCPAVIALVWGPTGVPGEDSYMVNVVALCDGPAPQWKTSVRLYDTEEQAREFGIVAACFWPPRA